MTGTAKPQFLSSGSRAFRPQNQPPVKASFVDRPSYRRSASSSGNRRQYRRINRSHSWHCFCSPYQSWCFNRRRFYYSNSCPSSGNCIAFYPPGSGNFYRRNRAGSPGSRLSPLSPLPSVLRPTDSPPYMPDH